MRSVAGGIDGLGAVFDDGSLVADAGLLLAGTVMSRLGLEALIDDTVRPGGSAGSGAGRKVLSLVASVLVGGCCIDDAQRLRSGSAAAVLPFAPLAPSTLGTFLRSFTFGHVRQLDKAAELGLVRAWSVGAVPGRLVNHSGRHRLRLPLTTSPPLPTAWGTVWGGWFERNVEQLAVADFLALWDVETGIVAACAALSDITHPETGHVARSVRVVRITGLADSKINHRVSYGAFIKPADLDAFAPGTPGPTWAAPPVLAVAPASHVVGVTDNPNLFPVQACTPNVL